MRTIQAITAQSLLFSFSYAFCSSSPRQSYPWTIGVGDVVTEVDYSSKGTSSLISGDAEDKVELKHSDPEVYNLVTSEVRRQRYGLELIASENFCSKAVREALGSCFTNKYSEGNVGKRYYGGNQYVDELEQLCMDRALDLFDLNTEEWGVNVQPYSGSPANFAVYTAMLQPHDRIMGLDLPSGGHLTHGFQTASGKKVSATSIYFESMPYVVSQETGLIDYDDMLYRAKMFRPSILIAGGSAYPREWDYARMKIIADEVGALLMVDMAHISGLVAAGVVDSPFAYADIVTSTTHKTLRGPRSGMIFARRSCEKRNGDDLMKAIDAAVFPALQGGPHNNQIAALAVALREAKSDSFREYAEQVLCNAQTLAQGLIQRGHKIATNGTDNHLLLWDLRPMGIAGSRLEKALEMASITANKNSLAGDTSAINPGGVRLGTPALTSRGLRSKDFEMVADFLHRAFEISIEAQQLATERSNGKKVLLKDYISALESMESIRQLREEVEEFSSGFYMPGGDERYITSD